MRKRLMLATSHARVSSFFGERCLEPAHQPTYERTENCSLSRVASCAFGKAAVRVFGMKCVSAAPLPFVSVAT